MKNKYMSKSRKMTLAILLLILTDQLIKIYISNNFMDKSFAIVSDLIKFQPIINIDYSWFNSIGQFGVGLWPHIIFSIISVAVCVFIFIFYKENYKGNIAINALLVLLLAGVICSLIDKVFWGGSLDYIYLKGFFTFDLKDVYISISQVILISYILVNYKKLK